MTELCCVYLSVRCIWLYVLIMWSTHFRVKLIKWLSFVLSIHLYGAFQSMFLSYHVRVSEWIHNSQNFFYIYILAFLVNFIYLSSLTTHYPQRQCKTKPDSLHFNVCSYHITYALQSESTIHRICFFYILAFLVNFIYLSSLTTHYPQRQGKTKADSSYHFSYYIVHSRDLRQLYHMINGKNITN